MTDLRTHMDEIRQTGAETRTRLLRCSCAVLAAVSFAPRFVAAQSVQSDSTRNALQARVLPTRPDSSPPWVTRRELLIAGVAGVASVLVSPLDRPVAGELQESGWQKDEPVYSASHALSFAGGPGPFVLVASMFAAGKIGGSDRLSSAGVHIGESVLLAATVTGIAKGIAGRALPGTSSAGSFQWGRGFHRGNGPFVSFPSGHAAAAFAVASALTGEVNAWRPDLGRYVGPSVYVAASAIGLARLYQHVHWVSDLPLAAAIGTWSGLSIESHLHRSASTQPVARLIRSTSVGVTPQGSTFVGLSLPVQLQSP